MEDVLLVRRMMDGDREAFDELMKKTQREIIRLAYLISGNHADSEDIAQETFVQAYLKRKEIREPEYFRTWLIRMMTRIAWRYLKKKGRERPAEDEELFAGMPRDLQSDLSRAAEQQEERETLAAAIRRLPVKHRTVVILYYFEELTTREIAVVTGCMEGTVKSRLHTARRKLKEELTGQRAPAGRGGPYEQEELQ